MSSGASGLPGRSLEHLLSQLNLLTLLGEGAEAQTPGTAAPTPEQQHADTGTVQHLPNLGPLQSVSQAASSLIRRNLTSLEASSSNRQSQAPTATNASSAAPSWGANPTITQADTQTAVDVESGSAGAVATQGEAPAAAATDETAAASAERHRLLTDTNLDMQALVLWLDNLLPYLLLCLALFLVRYIVRLLQLIWLLGCLHKLNMLLRKAWLRKDHSYWQHLQHVAPGMAYVGISVSACLYLTSSYWLLPCLLFQQPPAHAGATSAFSLCLLVAVLDCVARVLVVGGLQLPMLLACKVHRWLLNSGQGPASTLLPLASTCSHTGSVGNGPAVERARSKRLASLMAVLDMTAMLYRQALPAPLWYNFLVHHSTSNAIWASCLGGAYVTCKLCELFNGYEKLRGALHTCIEAQQGYGRPATPQEIQAASNQCPICQDSVKHGLRLQCGHVFCEECVTEWLERDITCPMCRKQVKEPDSSKGIAGSPLLPRLF